MTDSKQESKRKESYENYNWEDYSASDDEIDENEKKESELLSKYSKMAESIYTKNDLKNLFKKYNYDESKIKSEIENSLNRDDENDWNQEKKTITRKRSSKYDVNSYQQSNSKNNSSSNYYYGNNYQYQNGSKNNYNYNYNSSNHKGYNSSSNLNSLGNSSFRNSYGYKGQKSNNASQYKNSQKGFYQNKNSYDYDSYQVSNFDNNGNSLSNNTSNNNKYYQYSKKNSSNNSDNWRNKTKNDYSSNTGNSNNYYYKEPKYEQRIIEYDDSTEKKYENAEEIVEVHESQETQEPTNKNENEQSSTETGNNGDKINNGKQEIKKEDDEKFKQAKAFIDTLTHNKEIESLEIENENVIKENGKIFLNHLKESTKKKKEKNDSPKKNKYVSSNSNCNIVSNGSSLTISPKGNYEIEKVEDICYKAYYDTPYRMMYVKNVDSQRDSCQQSQTSQPMFFVMQPFPYMYNNMPFMTGMTNMTMQNEYPSEQGISNSCQGNSNVCSDEKNKKDE